MNANGHQKRRIIWAIVAFLAFAWIRFSIGLADSIYYGDAIHNDPYEATVLENIGALADGMLSIGSMLPFLCFTLFRICTGLPLMVFAIGMVLYHSVKMGQLSSESGGDQPQTKVAHREEKKKHD